MVDDRRRLQRDQHADLLSRLCMASTALDVRLAPGSQQGADARETDARAASLFATSAADDPSHLNAVVTVGPGALLWLWRGYADPAPRTAHEPRSRSPTGLFGQTLSSLLVANSRGFPNPPPTPRDSRDLTLDVSKTAPRDRRGAREKSPAERPYSRPRDGHNRVDCQLLPDHCPALRPFAQQKTQQMLGFLSRGARI